MDNLPEILRSKRFWSGVFGAVFMVVVSLVPELGIYRDNLIEAALVITGLLIGGFSVVDAAQAYSTGETKYLKPKQDVTDNVDSSVELSIQTSGKDNNRPPLG